MKPLTDHGFAPLLHLGIVPANTGFHGGVAQYSAAIMEALTSGGLPPGIGSITILREGSRIPGNGADPQWPTISLLPPGHPRRFLPALRALLGVQAVSWVGRQLRRSHAGSILFPVRERSEFGLWFRKHGLDFVFWTAPDPLAFECGMPFVMPIHDLQHRLQPQFPEVSESGQWQARERLCCNAARRATMLIADSIEGRDDILSYYGHLVPPERIAILPFVPPPHISVVDPDDQVRQVRKKFSLPERYFFYPAQFWPHKNHEGIVRALGLLRARGRQDISVVFCGSQDDPVYAPTRRAVMRLSAELGVGRQVTTLPYVPDALMAGLYLGSVGLVMPTFFGPTNIPILEAWRMGRPVITSDIRGVKSQAGDAALLVDASSPEDLAGAMQTLWDDRFLALRLVEAGRRRDASWTAGDFAVRLREILSAASAWARSDGGQRGQGK
jgi:glycosyltransferase involved in cell wall biosynthesis